MSLHSRPPAMPATPEHVTPEPHPAPRSDGTSPRASEPRPDRERASASRDEPSTAGATPWPWYRSEPWLAVTLAGFVPVVAAIFAPESAKYALIGLGALAAIAGIAMLVRQGPFRPHSGPARPPAGLSPVGDRARDRGPERATDIGRATR